MQCNVIKFGVNFLSHANIVDCENKCKITISEIKSLIEEQGCRKKKEFYKVKINKCHNRFWHLESYYGCSPPPRFQVMLLHLGIKLKFKFETQRA